MISAADLFCGAGGMTEGAVQSGRIDVKLAINHWRTAVFSHEANHPTTRHICARVEDFNVRDDDLPDFDLLMAGIECVYHSNARGSAPIDDQKRSSAWRVLDWMEAKRPAWCVFENVREFLGWGPIDAEGRKIKAKAGQIFNAWITAIRALGYAVDWKLLNAADFGAATKRVRLFIVCRLDRTDDFKWPRKTHFEPPRECSRRLVGVRYWRPAYEVINFANTGQSIFTRKRPLADKTLRRIRIGLEKFVENSPSPFIVKYHGGVDPGRDGTERHYSIHSPLPTIDSQPRFALASPYGVNMKGKSNAWDVSEPAPTVTSWAAHVGISLPFMVPQFGERHGQSARCYGVTGPLPAVTSHGAGAVVTPFLYQLIGRGAGRSYSPADPLTTIIAARENHGLISPFVVQSQGPGWNDANYDGVFDPVGTMPTILGRNNHAVVSPFLLPRQGIFDSQQLKRSRSLIEPVPTITASHSPGHVVTPFLVDPNWQDNRQGRNRVHSVTRPLGTITGANQKHLVTPFLMDAHNGSGDGRSQLITQPLKTIVGKPGDSLVSPYLVDVNHGADHNEARRLHSAVDPLGTITASRGTAISYPFFVKYYGSNDAADIQLPLQTVTAKDRFAIATAFAAPKLPSVENPSLEMVALLATCERLGVYDVHFRMLDVTELAAAQGFPDGYELFGNKADQIKQIGNSVSPPVMKALCEAIGEQS